MVTAIRRILLGAALPLIFATSFTVQAQTDIVENPDGSVSVIIDDQEVTIPARLAARIVDALRENAGDPQALRAAIRVLVTGSAGGAEDQALAAAIAAVAAFKSNGDSGVVAAIVEGASAGNPAVSPRTLLAKLPAVTAVAERQQPATVSVPPRSRPGTGAGSTMENPQQLSPAG